MILFKM